MAVMRRHVALMAIVVLTAGCAPVTPTATVTPEPLASPSPTQSPSLTPTPDPHAFQLHVLSATWSHELNGTADQPAAWAYLKSADLSQDLATIEAPDITTYDWASQTLALTDEATFRLLAPYNPTNVAPPTQLLEMRLDGQLFVVTMNGKRLFGGIVLYQGS